MENEEARLINRAVIDIFEVSQKDVIRDMRSFLGLLDVEALCVKRRAKFLSKTRMLSHTLSHSLTSQFCILCI